MKNLDIILKAILVLAVLGLLYVYQTKDRYQYHGDFTIFDRQQGVIYSLQEGYWIKVSPFEKSEKIPFNPAKPK